MTNKDKEIDKGKDSIPVLYSIDQTCKLLKISHSMIYKIPPSLLPKQRVGGRLLFREIDIIAYLDAQYIAS